jgi:hypothetical protein
MKKIVLILLTATVFTGCATVSKQPMAVEVGSAMKEQTLTHTVRSKKQDFVANSYGKNALGILGAFSAISEGNQIIANNQVADPADEIARGLADALQASRGAKIAGGPINVDADSPAAIAAAAGGKAKYVLDVQTLVWNLLYFPTDMTHYRVIYTARARLIDTASNAVVAEGGCKRWPESNTDAPTYDQLVANNAALLKKELSIAASECVATLKTEMLAL